MENFKIMFAQYSPADQNVVHYVQLNFIEDLYSQNKHKL